MALQRTQRSNLVEQIVSQMQGLVESGMWPVGSRIPPEPELAKQLEVSRNTVREAVRALVHAGMLSVRQGDGTYVCSASAFGAALARKLQLSQLRDTLEVRYALEQEAARLAAERRTPEDEAALRDCLAQCEAAFALKDRQAYLEADLRLHRTVAEAAHNQVLLELYEHMSDFLRTSIDSSHDALLFSHAHAVIHRNMVEAIWRGDQNAAADAVRLYIAEASKVLSP